MVEKDSKKEVIKNIVSQVEEKSVDASELTISDKIDRIVAHKYIGILIFAVIMFIVFTISQTLVGPWIQGLLEWLIGEFTGIVGTGLEKLGTGDLLTGLIIDGIIGGFAAVIGFLPLIMILFYLLNLLEDSGYMARVAVVMDRYFKKIGLAGKSIIPIYVGTACSIPAIMSSRTIKNERQRRMTVLLTPFVPCGAKLPVIALFVGVFFSGYSYLTATTYLLAIAVIFFAGWVIKSITGADFTNEEDSFFIVELPEYKIPSFKRAFFVMLDSAWAFIKKAATIIILMNFIVWFLANFDWTLSMVDNTNVSMLRDIARPFAWLFTPLGFGVWGLAAAAILGFIAKEEIVGALAVIFAFSISEDLSVVSVDVTRDIMINAGGLTAVSAFAYMAFNLFTPPCFAAIGAMNAELGSRKWTIFAVSLQTAVGYIIALVIYQLGTIIAYGELGISFGISIVILIGFTGLFMYLKKLAKQGKGLANIG